MIIQADIISSRQNPFVKWAISLQDKKGRALNSVFIAEGEKLTFEAVEASLPVKFVLLAESKVNKLKDKILNAFSDEKYDECRLVVIKDDVFEKISTEKAPQGVISVIKYLDFFNELDIIYKEDFFLSEDERAIALCSVRDPGNLGSVIRSAVAFGVDHIILSGDCADVYNPKTIRSSMSSVFRVKITRVKDFSSFISASRDAGRRVYSAELTEGAVSLKDIAVNRGDVFVIGNEGHGIPLEISSLCDKSVYIPISKKTESLNAAVAAAIFMWHISN